MRRAISLSLSLLVLVSLLLAASAGHALILEASCVVGASQSDIERVQRLASQDRDLALSDQCTQAVLEDCFVAIGSVYGRAAGLETRNQLLDTCERLSGQILIRAPAHAYAWLIDATVAGERSDWERMRHGLILSRQASPNLGWLSRRRFAIGEQHYAELDEAGRDSHLRDIAVAVQSVDGRQQVALYYSRRPHTRDRIAEAVDTLSSEQQNAFLSAVRSASRTMSSHGSG